MYIDGNVDEINVPIELLTAVEHERWHAASVTCTTSARARTTGPS
ncbi:hypothetical protein [Georgenia wangjunii]